ncbi:MAG: hypothetical protein WCG47_03870 [Dermatophilaceae bacterium]
MLKPEPPRQAIASSISANVKAYNVPTFSRLDDEELQELVALRLHVACAGT